MALMADFLPGGWPGLAASEGEVADLGLRAEAAPAKENQLQQAGRHRQRFIIKNKSSCHSL